MKVLKLSPTTDLIRQTLGNYQLVKFIGQGSFATIYLGKHKYLSTQAAVKVLRSQLTSDEIKRFCIEARTAAHLIHPHIVRVLEFGQEDRIPFLVMDYAPNGTMRNRCPEGQLLSLNAILNYIKQIADALEYIHNHGLIHQDIKPENILLGRGNQVLLSDFGIAVVANKVSSLSKQESAGTLPYMAPEQILGNPCFASDQYALGIAVYEWLCGELPFHGSSHEIVQQHLYASPPLMRKKNPTISSGIEKVVLRALAKQPQQRFDSVQEFVIALERTYTGTSLIHHSSLHYQPIQYSHLELEKPVLTSPLGVHYSLLELEKSVLSQQSQDKRRKVNAFWKDVSTIIIADMLIGTIVSGILYELGFETRNLGFIFSLCIVSFPLLRAVVMKKHKAFILVSSMLIVSAIFGIGFHSKILFAAVYFGLLMICILVGFKHTACCFKNNHNFDVLT